MIGKRFLPGSGTLVILVLVAACTNILEGRPLANATVPDDVQRIFTASCTTSGCHNGTSRAGGLNLEPGAADAIIGRQSEFGINRIISPGKPDQSELLLRLISTDLVVRMPRGSGPLGAEDIETIRNWIARLAPEASPSPSPTPAPTPTPQTGRLVGLAKDVQPIFRASCSTIGCHDTFTRQNNLELSSAGVSFAQLVGTNAGVLSLQYSPFIRVVPGDPGNSVLFVKVASDGPRIGATAVGGRMPSGRPPIAAADIETIRLWIVQGALNN